MFALNQLTLTQQYIISNEPNDAAHPSQNPHFFFTQNNSSSTDDDACQPALQSFEQRSFGLAKCRLAVTREDIRNGNSELLANHFVGIMSGPAGASRKLTSNRRF